MICMAAENGFTRFWDTGKTVDVNNNNGLRNELSLKVLPIPLVVLNHLVMVKAHFKVDLLGL